MKSGEDAEPVETSRYGKVESLPSPNRSKQSARQAAVAPVIESHDDDIDEEFELEMQALRADRDEVSQSYHLHSSLISSIAHELDSNITW